MIEFEGKVITTQRVTFKTRRFARQSKRLPSDFGLINVSRLALICYEQYGGRLC